MKRAIGFVITLGILAVVGVACSDNSDAHGTNITTTTVATTVPETTTTVPETATTIPETTTSVPEQTTTTSPVETTVPEQTTTVPEVPPTIPRTGGESATEAVIAWVLILAGILALVLVRRRETRRLMSNFVHLHLHSEYSLLDGMTSPEEAAQIAASSGQSAVAISDHGTMAGVFRFKKACEKNNITPIFGCEAYFVPSLIADSDEKKQNVSI